MVDRVTMEDIAERAGVSINTVSRALNDKTDINDGTKEEILKIAEELNYQPNRFAKGLRSSKTSTLGVIVADIQNPFFSALLKGVEKAARKEGYSIIVQDTDEKYTNEQSAVQTVLAEQVDGLLISPAQTNEQTIMDLQQSGLPFVLLGRYFKDLDTNFIVTHDVQGATAAIDHLVELGHEQIAIVNGPSHISSSKERLEVYRKAMTHHGLVTPENFIFKNIVTMEQGYENGKRLLSQSNLPTAVFCYSDFVALGVIKAARDVGLRVPEELAVVGYDDIFFSAYLEVPLTTVRIPKYKLGKKAFEILNGILENKNQKTKLKLPVELIKRESTLGR